MTTPRPIDADNHYYEALDAFTRHLPKEFKRRGVRPVQSGKRVELLIADRVNRFIPNPTFDPIIVPGCLDLFLRGRMPEGADRSKLVVVLGCEAASRLRERSGLVDPLRHRRRASGGVRHQGLVHR